MLVTEDFHLLGGRVDRTGPYPVVRNALLCGRESKHKRRYLNEAFESDRKVYEGADVHLNHGPGNANRAYESRIAWVETEDRNAAGLPTGDLGVNPKHPYAEAFLWDVENRPQNCKLSHVADISTRPGKDGWVEVTKINRVDAVDIVTNAGTTKTIFEGAPVAVKTRDFMNKLAPKCDVEQLYKWRLLVKEEGFGEADMMADAAPADAEGMTGGNGLDAALKAECAKEIDECMAASSSQEARKKCLENLKKILGIHGDLKDEPEAPKKEEKKVEAEKTEECAPPKKTAVVKEDAPEVKKWNAYSECVKEGYAPDEADIPMIAGIADQAERLKAIRRLKGLTRATAPKGGSREQVKEDAPTTTTPKTIHEATGPEQIAALVRDIRKAG